MTAWASKRSGNWSRTSDNADSPWHDGGAQTALASYPGGAGTGDTVTIGDGVTATQAVVLDANPANSIASVANGDNTSYVSVTTARTLVMTGSPAINSTTTNTSGFVRVSSTGSLTITHNQGAGTAAVRQSTGAGYCIRLTDSGSLSVSNVGGTAVFKNSPSSRAISAESTGTHTVIGEVAGASSYAWYQNAGTTTITGNISASGSNNPAVYVETSGTITLDGLPLASSTTCYGIAVGSGGTVVWVGAYSTVAGQYVSIRHHGTGALVLANASSALTLNCGGAFELWCAATGTITTSAAGGTAQIILQDSSSSAAILGRTTGVNIITMLNLSAANVKSGVTIHGVAGTLPQGGVSQGLHAIEEGITA